MLMLINEAAVTRHVACFVFSLNCALTHRPLSLWGQARCRLSALSARGSRPGQRWLWASMQGAVSLSAFYPRSLLVPFVLKYPFRNERNSQTAERLRKMLYLEKPLRHLFTMKSLQMKQAPLMRTRLRFSITQKHLRSTC